MSKATDPTLAREWDSVISKGLWDKRTYFHCLASDDNTVIVYVEAYPGRGFRVHISPPRPEFEDTDLVRWVIRDTSSPTDPQSLERQKELADACYAEWLNGKLPTRKIAREWATANVQGMEL